MGSKDNKQPKGVGAERLNEAIERLKLKYEKLDFSILYTGRFRK
jgi:hypothetical protein